MFIKPGFHIVVSVVSVVSAVRKKIIGQIQLYGNLPYKCSIQKKRRIQLVVRDRMNSICPMNFFRTTDTTDTTDATIWNPGLRQNCQPAYRDPCWKNRDLGNQASPLSHMNKSKFLQRIRGNVRSRKPGRPGQPGSYEEALKW